MSTLEKGTLTQADALQFKPLHSHCHSALQALDRYLENVHGGLRSRLSMHGEIDAALLEVHQFALHGYAWAAAYGHALHNLLTWAERLCTDNRFGELEALILQAGFGGYLAQLGYGIGMSQDEFIRAADLGADNAALALLGDASVCHLIKQGDSIDTRMAIVELIEHNTEAGLFGDAGLDETMTIIRDQFRRFTNEQVLPEAQHWHNTDSLIPLDLIEQMAELGVFAITIPESYDGLGMSKQAMCITTEELSRGYIGVGSLATRSEIAAELILRGGRDDQKERYLSRLAAGAILPTAVFTEPNTGSDLASLSTRAVHGGDSYRITGNKTWITHAARADLMTLLARTNPEQSDYRGLSMFLIDKPRGTGAEPFPATGMNGSEIPVIGYRGMKEYELSFDNFEVPAGALLGESQGQGFKQLMATFESARIQTAARAIGVAQNALELGLRYARDRVQFGKPIIRFPRVAGKLGWMVVELMLVRQLAYAAAASADTGTRSDIEAGMAKLLAARVAWSCADNAVQIHGGNGYAIEYPISRVLCDARVLNIFEGTAEIQAQIIARGLLNRDA